MHFSQTFYFHWKLGKTTFFYHFLLESQRALAACFGAYFLKLEQEEKKQRMDFFYLWLSTQTGKRRTSLLGSIVRAQFAQYGISFFKEILLTKIFLAAQLITQTDHPRRLRSATLPIFGISQVCAESAGSDSKLHNACSSKNQTHVL